VARRAHALKSASASVGAAQLAAALGRVEHAASAGEASTVETCVTEITAGHNAACRALRLRIAAS
jgi:HPt (histidine-containing phosphotransfer) domain-containing protein